MRGSQESEARDQESEVRGQRSGVRSQKSGETTLILILCCALLMLSLGCKEKVKPGAAEVKRQAVAGVTVVEVAPSRVDEYYETSGTLKAKTTSVIASRVMGTVTSLKVKEGDRVKAGQVLMTIDDRDMTQKVTGAEAGYREALKALEAAQQHRVLLDVTYQRYKRLYDEKALTRQEIDQIETQKKIADIDYERAQEAVNRAKAGLSEAEVYHGFTRITAPVAGVVIDKRADPGSMATPGTPLLTVEDTSSFTFEAAVSESLAGKLSPGMSVDIVIDSVSRPIKGTISEIVPAIDPLSRTFMVKVGLAREGLKTGLYGKIRIPVGARETVLVPERAIVERGQLTGVYAVDDKGVMSYRLIRTGKKYQGGVEALSGIRAGDRIVTDGIDRAIDGGIIKQ